MSSTRTVNVTLTRLDSPEEAQAYLRAAAPPGPSLHPHVDSPDPWKRWNGWNTAVANGIDAAGMPVLIESWHFASRGRVDYSGQRNGGSSRLGSIAYDGFVWPIEVFPAVQLIHHPEHTPEARQ